MGLGRQRDVLCFKNQHLGKNRPLKTDALNRFKVFKCKSLKEQKCYF